MNGFSRRYFLEHSLPTSTAAAVAGMLTREYRAPFVVPAASEV